MVGTKKRIIAFLEGFVLANIILVLIHTFVQDIGNLYNWPWVTRQVLIYIGCAFDIFFSIEFLTRFFSAITKRNLIAYMRDGRGWVDLIASIPLLVLSSGPEALSAFYDVPIAFGSFGVFGVLKVVKAIRIARVLRLLRLLKIFKHIKHVDSVMAQRHITRIATLIVTTVIISLVGFSFLATFVDVPNLEHSFEEYTIQVLNTRITATLTAAEAQEIAEVRPDILIMRRGEEILFSRHNNAYYDRYYGPSDYTLLMYDQFNTEVFIDLLPLVAHDARADILHYIIIIALILVTLFMYGPHFATTISDPIQVMARGFSQRGYALRVLASKRFKNDEISHLSSRYNDIYLPLKDQSAEKSGEGSVVDIDIEDVKTFLK